MSPRTRAASSIFRLSATAEAERVLDGHDSGEDEKDVPARKSAGRAEAGRQTPESRRRALEMKAGPHRPWTFASIGSSFPGASPAGGRSKRCSGSARTQDALSVPQLLAAAKAMSSDLDSDSDDSESKHVQEQYESSLLASALRLNGFHRARSASPVRYRPLSRVRSHQSPQSSTPGGAKSTSSSSARHKSRMGSAQRRYRHSWVVNGLDFSSDDAETLDGSSQTSTPLGTVSSSAWIAQENSPAEHAGPKKLDWSVARSSPIAAMAWQAQQTTMFAPDAEKEIWIINFSTLKDDNDGELRDILHSLDGQQGKDFAADPPLAEEDRARAAKLGSFFTSTGGLDELYVSPYLRSLQIGAQLAWATNRKLLVEPGLSNVPHTFLESASARKLDRFMNFPCIDLRHQPATMEPAAGESFLESIPRVLDAGHHIAARMTARKRVAVITHTVTGAALAAGLVSGCRPSCYQQNEANLRELRKLLQTIESGHTCGAYRLCYNEETQAWVSDLKCHALYGKGEGRNKLQTSQSYFANSPLGHPKDWERVWAAACDKYVRSIVRNKLSAESDETKSNGSLHHGAQQGARRPNNHEARIAWDETVHSPLRHPAHDFKSSHHGRYALKLWQ